MIIHGIVSFLPLAYLVMFAASVLHLEAGVNPDPLPFEAYVDWHLIAMILTLLLLIFDLFLIYGTSHLARARRIAWTIALLLGHAIVFPLFWYFCVWKSKRHPS